MRLSRLILDTGQHATGLQRIAIFMNAQSRISASSIPSSLTLMVLCDSIPGAAPILVEICVPLANRGEAPWNVTNKTQKVRIVRLRTCLHHMRSLDLLHPCILGPIGNRLCLCVLFRCVHHTRRLCGNPTASLINSYYLDQLLSGGFHAESLSVSDTWVHTRIPFSEQLIAPADQHSGADPMHTCLGPLRSWVL